MAKDPVKTIEDLDLRVDDLEDGHAEITKSLALIDQRVEHMADKMDFNVTYLTEKIETSTAALAEKLDLSNKSDEKIMEHLERLGHITERSVKRIEKAEDALFSSNKRKLLFRRLVLAMVLSALAAAAAKIASYYVGVELHLH
jgi:hypothetical protein